MLNNGSVPEKDISEHQASAARRGEPMDLVADVLLMLSAFALRTQFMHKAIWYGRLGTTLYPEDVRLREIYGYALLLDGRTAEAAAAVENKTAGSRNIAFLRMRILMQRSQTSEECRNAIKAYLRWEDTR